MPTTNIDDVLMGAAAPRQTTVPSAPEVKEPEYNTEPEEVEELEPETPEYESEPEEPSEPKAREESDESDEKERELEPVEYDDYGNEKERMPKGMKERLDRKEKQHQREIDRREAEINELRSQLAQQGASPQVQRAAKEFEFDPDAQGDWQQQLASFVKQTVTSMTREQQETQTRNQEAQDQREFETKFKNGIGKFNDFVDVIESLPFEITNPMTLATRAMADPAAFLYAAAKRNPKELERISKIRDPYAQMTEMGRLEERMRKNKTTTQAPRPLSRSHDDAGSPAPKKSKEPSIEDLIAKADAKKLANRNAKRGR